MSFQLEIDRAIKDKTLYFLGEQLPPDWYAGFRLWLQLAESGNHEAQYNVGRCYLLGNGVDQDIEQAKHWLTQASDNGEPRSLFDLYRIYSENPLNSSEQEASKKYLELAIQRNEARAVKLNEEINKRKAEEEAKQREQAAALIVEEEAKKRLEERKEKEALLNPILDEFKNAFVSQDRTRMVKCANQANEVDSDYGTHLKKIASIELATYVDNHRVDKVFHNYISNGNTNTLSASIHYYDYWLVLKNTSNEAIQFKPAQVIPPNDEVRIKIGNFEESNIPKTMSLSTFCELADGKKFRMDIPVRLDSLKFNVPGVRGALRKAIRWALILVCIYLTLGFIDRFLV